jgi:hypothetical protein
MEVGEDSTVGEVEALEKEAMEKEVGEVEVVEVEVAVDRCTTIQSTAPLASSRLAGRA